MMRHPLLSMATFLLAGLVLTAVVTLAILDDLRRRTALESARAYVASLEAVRDYYTQIVVPRAAEAGAAVRHDYAVTPRSIPLPATLSIEIGNRLDRIEGPAHTRFYSRYPYPWRTDGGPRDDFERRALDQLETPGTQPYSEVSGGFSGGTLRYAAPVVMRAGCLGCHNTDPASPRQDWRAGDVRGVQAVTIALPPLLPTPKALIAAGPQPILLAVLIVGALLFLALMLFALLRRLKRAMDLAIGRAEQLEQARLLAETASAAKSRLMANVSHELRTPLNAIIGFSELIAHETFGPVGNERYRTYAGDIRGSGERLLGIVSNMVDFAEIDSGRIELVDADIDLEAEFERARSLMAPLADTHVVQVSLLVPPQMPKLRADRRALRNILANLLTNAVKHGGEGTHAWLVASMAGDRPRIEVRDNGVGIAPADLERVQQPFERSADPSYASVEGIGLGLPIVRELAALHGAIVQIASAPGQGTTVSVTFPADRAVRRRRDEPGAGGAEIVTPFAALR